MGIFRKTNGRPRLWLIMLMPVAVVAAGFFVANIVQPENFAQAPGCIAKTADGYVNSCERTINLTVCDSLELADGTCQTFTLGEGQSTADATPRPGLRIETPTFACVAPYLPSSRRNINNQSLRENGCVQPQ